MHKGAIFRDDDDRASLLSIVTQVLQACDAQAFAYCLMGNHYHFVFHTRQPNLSVVMHRVNSVYSLTYAQRRYADWVEAGQGVELWKGALRGGRFLGDEAFVESVLKHGR